MICPRLAELPLPPVGKFGWPWTEESGWWSNSARRDTSWPRISVITPSFNQAEFIEETIRSILLQGYPDLEYLVLDGGSTDGSVEIIKKYSRWISYWVSEPDAGQSDAINRGLRRATGQYATWINSDDRLCQNALLKHASEYGFREKTVYIGNCQYIDASDALLSIHQSRVHSLEDLVSIGKIWRAGGQIVQPEVLFPRELALTVGGVNPDNHFTMDYELWGKLLLAEARFQYTGIPFGAFRKHPDQKIYDVLRTTDSLLDAAAKLIGSAVSFSEATKRELMTDLEAYRVKYRRDYWRGTGRLARIGLPRGIVAPIRNLRAVCRKMIKTRGRKFYPASW